MRSEVKLLASANRLKFIERVLKINHQTLSTRVKETFELCSTTSDRLYRPNWRRVAWKQPGSASLPESFPDLVKILERNDEWSSFVVHSNHCANCARTINDGKSMMIQFQQVIQNNNCWPPTTINESPWGKS